MLSDLDMQIFRMQIAAFIENWKSYGYKIGIKKSFNDNAKTISVSIKLNKGSNDVEVSIIIQTAASELVYSDMLQPEFAEAPGSIEMLASSTKDTDKNLSQAILEDLHRRLAAPMDTGVLH